MLMVLMTIIIGGYLKNIKHVFIGSGIIGLIWTIMAFNRIDYGFIQDVGVVMSVFGFIVAISMIWGCAFLLCYLGYKIKCIWNGYWERREIKRKVDGN